jgi:hypothetical protein
MVGNAGLLHIDADIANAWSLPASFYIDPAVAQTENDRIFARTWQVVGHRDQLTKPGDYFTKNWWANRCCSLAGRMGKSAGFTTFAATGRDRRRKVAGRANYFDVDITGGPMGSMES